MYIFSRKTIKFQDCGEVHCRQFSQTGQSISLKYQKHVNLLNKDKYFLKLRKQKGEKFHTSVVETLDMPAVVSEESFSFDAPDMPVISDAPFKNTEDVSEIGRIALFKSMFVFKDLFKVPAAWTRCDINDGDFQAMQFVQCTGRMDSGVVKTISQKIVVLYKDMTVHASVMDVPIKMQEIGFLSEYVSSSKELEDMVNVFHKYKI